MGMKQGTVQSDTDHYRYRALLRDANDEPKRLALIQLLVDERARDKLAAEFKTAKSELSPGRLPLVRSAPTHQELPQEPAEKGFPRWLGVIGSAAAAEHVASIGVTRFAAPVAASEFEPPPFPQKSAELSPHDKLIDPAQSVVVDTTAEDVIASIPFEPREDLAVRVDTLVSAGATTIVAEPVATMASKVSPAVGDAERTSTIKAEFIEPIRIPWSQGDFGTVPSKAANPEVPRSLTVVRTPPNALVARFVRLMSEGLTVPDAANPSTAITSPFDDNFAKQIEALLAKRKRDLQ